eukprot:TRINITY_DN1337_c2_g1_i8.p2 TRINITY_DN1337_c2_g1~~TRINITY_DN1337_c2_g1_i8.p2  ORF type:complete len:204 (+),score=-19.16 TRINITY_DN1337_c2_g1_i8:208-819(+)
MDTNSTTLLLFQTRSPDIYSLQPKPLTNLRPFLFYQLINNFFIYTTTLLITNKLEFHIFQTQTQKTYAQNLLGPISSIKRYRNINTFNQICQTKKQNTGQIQPPLTSVITNNFYITKIYNNFINRNVQKHGWQYLATNNLQDSFQQHHLNTPTKNTIFFQYQFLDKSFNCYYTMLFLIVKQNMQINTIQYYQQKLYAGNNLTT